MGGVAGRPRKIAGSKICKECGITKALAEFPRDGRCGEPTCSHPACYKPRCKTPCWSKWQASYRARDPKKWHAYYNAVYRRPDVRTRALAYSKQYYRDHLERYRAHGYRRRYGLTLETWNELLTRQDGMCALCRGEMRRVVVDHDHANGHVRGLLCDRCNLLLGQVEQIGLPVIMAYLEQ